MPEGLTDFNHLQSRNLSTPPAQHPKPLPASAGFWGVAYAYRALSTRSSCGRRRRVRLAPPGRAKPRSATLSAVTSFAIHPPLGRIVSSILEQIYCKVNTDMRQ